MRLPFILCVLCLPMASGCCCMVDALLDCDDDCHRSCGHEYRHEYACDRSCAPRPRHCH